MKIIAAVTDSKRKSLMFMLDSLQVISLDDAIKYVKDEKIDGVHIVRGKSGNYIRTNRSLERKNIDAMSVSLYRFVIPNATKSLLALHELKDFWKHYQTQLQKRIRKGDVLITVEGEWPLATKEHVRETMLPYGKHIFTAAKRYNIDPCLLGAILIDEIVRLAPLEDVRDKALAFAINKNVSVGVGQIQLKNIRAIIEKGYYNPNPSDENLLSENINSLPYSYFHKYAADKKHSVYFAAAFIRYLIDEWVSVIELQPNIIATLYHLEYRRPHAHPEPNERGIQIVNEFYPMAKELFNQA